MGIGISFAAHVLSIPLAILSSGDWSSQRELARLNAERAAV